MRRLEQLERVPVRIQQLDLLAAGTGLYLVSVNSPSATASHPAGGARDTY